MIRAEHEFTLPVPPKEAFALLSDPAKDPDWQTACKSTRLLNGEARPGCQYEILFHMVGKKMQFTVEILDYEPGVLSRFKTLDGPFGYLGTYRYSEQPDGTTAVHWTFEVDPGDYFGVMPLSLVKKLLISQVKKDSGRLAGTLAAQGAAALA
ncbi:SRPBCC family protein [Actinacidiphila guanduensis]|jgi:uncharacterized protein YndB with AHSA1/START domain|uniref:Polyketide cyclase / dehydrase and lipid transport n=1 Tax=Actinacidiphila guanduensis TaxID=310781 RepID=A0A1H0RV56_9ACTN|nr:SRPBCC family protein [Actinacidiphila guanduensis]SDP33270.1 Polyketide cyclase / dehydrase and lipid transport [Actinacidiphila guanduensis]